MASYFDVFRGSVVAYAALELYLLKRRSNATHRGLPAELKDVVSAEEYETGREYNRDKISFGYVSELYGLATTLVTVRFWPLLWTLAGSLQLPLLSPFSLQLSFTEAPEGHWLWQPAAFVLIQSLIDEVLGLPTSVYSTFVIEEKHGFNKFTAGSYAAEKAKGLLLNLVMSVVMWGGFIPIIEYAGSNSWWYLWIFISCFIFVFNMAYPVLIAPMFNTVLLLALLLPVLLLLALLLTLLLSLSLRRWTRRSPRR